MPSWFSDHFPFLRSRRSRRSRAGSTSLPRIESAPAFPSLSRPSSRLGISREDMNATATAASHDHLSVPGNSIDHQLNSTDRHVGDLNTQSSQQPTFPASSSNHTDSVQAQQLLVPPSPPLAATPSQQSLNSDPLIYPSQPQHWSSGMFKDAHDFSVKGGTFQNIKGNVTYNNPSSNQFMEKLLEKTIPGAEFDSSAREPPPRCHPETRLDLLERCRHFVRTSKGKRKTRWVVGAAGVGKSAIMQSVVESPELAVNCRASVFFSINGRDDGTKAVATISYQLAVKSELYRQLIEREITCDPALLRSSMAKQFLKLIVEPFIHNPQLNSAGRALIVIDGLDECKNPQTQLELLRLISDLCIEYPSSPLVWLIASRPEQHITSFFSQSDIAPAYEKEEIVVNSDKAREDVEQYLRDKLTEIKKKASDTVDPRWPEEQDLWKIAHAADGLFAYADTAVKYIGDTTVGSPASQLSDVLNVIDDHPMTGVPREEHPMALLDMLYTRILSNIPSKVKMNTRKLLLALAFAWGGNGPDNFILLCNWLGMTPDDAYAAINHLRSVLRVPGRYGAHKEGLELFHKSFIDYISDFRRSGFSHDIQHEARQLMAQCAFRILNTAPNGIHFGDVDYQFSHGTLRRGPGTGDKISITWPVDEDVNTSGNATRLQMYQRAIEEVVYWIDEDPTFQSEFYIHILSTQIIEYDEDVEFGWFRDLVFDESRRQEFMMQGILKQMPLKAVDVFARSSYQETKLQFRRPASTATNLLDPWNPSCKHGRKGKWEERGDQNWETSFLPHESNGRRASECNFCMARLERHVEDWKTRSPDHVVPTLFTSMGWCGVEFRFVDPIDGISEWTYRFWMILSLEERKKNGSNV
ncbi:hypothetical protein Agabi119p4_8381 [Agaricus bisporus var. burnettii]|uniref:Nephrocystin 3-like N-terminal domain-containing protein n=1 Tax=Agaricus bisporus var. burnettii TaxID=192524 RepID=A0A8H7EYY1_AGABI|nr:hypothetical protein Agabi119p4_8381 [Agaricus bisporus var. burnettii]